MMISFILFLFLFFLGGSVYSQFKVFTHLFLRGIHSKWEGVLTAPSVVHEYSTEGR